MQLHSFIPGKENCISHVWEGRISAPAEAGVCVLVEEAVLWPMRMETSFFRHSVALLGRIPILLLTSSWGSSPGKTGKFRENNLFQVLFSPLTGRPSFLLSFLASLLPSFLPSSPSPHPFQKTIYCFRLALRKVEKLQFLCDTELR